MNKKTMAILKLIAKDMASSDPVILDELTQTMKNNYFISLLIEAGCPKEIINQLKESLKLTPVQRYWASKKILSDIKKCPGTNRG
jgi:hypothetical protein